MPTTYNGLPGNEARKAPLTITNATNAIAPNPIQITTSAAHGLTSGEYVYIYGVQGNLAANGRFYIAVTGVTTFTLYSSFVAGNVSGPVSGSGAYVGTGANVCQPLAWNVAGTLPDDGDALNATAINTPLEGNFDRETWLLGRAANYALSGVYKDNLPFALPTVATAMNIISGAPGWGVPQNIAGPSISDPKHVLYGDVIEMVYTTTAAITAGGGPMALRLELQLCDWNGGVLYTFNGQAVSLDLAVQVGMSLQLMFDTSVLGPALSASREALVNIAAYSAAGAQQATLYGSSHLTTRIWRPVS